MNNLNLYQNQAITTKIYDDSVAIPYVVLGLVGEASELFEKIIQMATVSMSTREEALEERDLLMKEAADVMWYLAALASETDQRLQDVCDSVHIETDGNMVVEGVVMACGQIAELTKKALRDDFTPGVKFEFKQDKLSWINKYIALTVILLQTVADDFDFDMDVALADNVKKLQSRAERGVLGGSGDMR